MELSDRKRRILKAIVESYIDTAEAVGSKMLVNSFFYCILGYILRSC